MKRKFNILIQILFALLFVLFSFLFDFLSIIAVSLLAPILAYIISFSVYELVYSTTHGSDKYRKYLDCMVFYTIFIQFISNFIGTNMTVAQFVVSVVIIVFSFILGFQKAKRMRKLNIEILMTFILPILSIGIYKIIL